MITKKQLMRQLNQFLEQYPTNHFNVARTCRAVGISRQTFYNWMKAHKDFKEKIDGFAEEDLDNAEEALRIMRQGIPRRDANGKIIGWVIEPNPAAVIFTLKTKGRNRGWSEEGQIPSEDGRLKIELVSDKDEGNQDFSEKLLKQSGSGGESRRDEEQ